MKERQQAAIRHVIESAAYRSDFPGWLAAHWHVFAEFERMALFAVKQGRPRLSAKFLFEMIRWNTMLKEGGPYKLNGNFSADCARLFDHLHPGSAGLFEFRRRIGVAA